MSFATYVINLPRDRERLTHVSKLMEERGIPFELVEAVDGRALTAEEWDRWVPPSGAPRPLIPGEVGCFLSHRRLWERIVERELPYGVVFEDDIQLSPDAGAVLSDLGWLPRDADIVRLETTLVTVVLDRLPAASLWNRAVRRLHSFHWGTAGYIISRRAAKALLNLNSSITIQVDDFMFNPERAAFRELNIYQLDPAICVQTSVLNPTMVVAGGIGDRSDVVMPPKLPRPKGFALLSRETRRAGRKALSRARDFVKYRRRRIVRFG